MAAKPKPDWKQIEADYRAGQKTLRQMGAEHGLSHTAVNKRAKRDGWLRGLPPEKVSRGAARAIPTLVLPAVPPKNRPATRAKTQAKPRPKTEKPAQTGQKQHITPAIEPPKTTETIEVTPQLQAEVIHSQRLEIPRARTLAARMLRELEAQTCKQEDFQYLAQLLSSAGSTEPPKAQEKEQEKQLELFRKALSLSTRVSTLKSLTDILKILVALERQVFDIENEQPRTPIEGLTDEQVNQRLMRLMAKVKA